MVYVPEMPRVDAAGAVGSGFDLGQSIGSARTKRKAKNALQRIYEGDKAALADLMAADPEAGRQVDTQMGIAKYVNQGMPAQELAGPTKGGEALTTESVTPSVDVEGLTAYLASRGDSGALKALMEKAGPEGKKWLGTTIRGADGKIYAIEQNTGLVDTGVMGEKDAPKVEKPPKQQMVRGDDGQVYWLEPGEQLPPGVTAKGSAPSLNEGERNAAGFYERATETGQKINALEDAGGALPTAGTDLAGLLGDYVESKAMSDEQQTYRTLAMSWIRAKLRKESGAAISDKEAESEYKTYFPVPGDSPMRIEEKRRLRAIAENELKMSAGRAITDKPQGGQPSGIPPIPPGIPPIPEKFAAGRNNPKYVEYWIARHQQTKADGTPMTAADRRRIDERARQNGVVK